MANIDNLEMEIVKKQAQQNKQLEFKHLITIPRIQEKFVSALGDSAGQWIANLSQLAVSDLQGVDPYSIIGGAMVSASLNLPLTKGLGYAYLIKYGNQAQFQIGYKGFIQLALRTNQYLHINAIEVYEGELVKFNRLSEQYELGEPKSDKIVGYMATFTLINGFIKTVYWSKEKMEAHAKDYSRSYTDRYGNVNQKSIWYKHFDDMAKKTIIKNTLSKWGILSIELQKAMQSDQAVINKGIDDNTEITEENLNYVDNGGYTDDQNTEIEVEFKDAESTIS